MIVMIIMMMVKTRTLTKMKRMVTSDKRRSPVGSFRQHETIAIIVGGLHHREPHHLVL